MAVGVARRYGSHFKPLIVVFITTLSLHCDHRQVFVQHEQSVAVKAGSQSLYEGYCKCLADIHTQRLDAKVAAQW